MVHIFADFEAEPAHKAEIKGALLDRQKAILDNLCQERQRTPLDQAAIRTLTQRSEVLSDLLEAL